VIGSGLWGVIAALAVTFGLLAIALHLLKRFQASPGWGGRGVPLQVLKRISVGPKQGVALLRVADRVLVVSIADAGTSLLAELTDSERDEALGNGGAPNPAKTTRPSSILRLPHWGKVAMLVAMLAVPAHVHAAQMQSPSPPASVTARPAQAAPQGLVVAPPAPPKVDIKLGEGAEALHLSGAVGLVVFLGFLTLLPAMFLLMTSFTRILIVLHFLRSALGAQTTPPSQLLVAVAVLLTAVVMNPVLQKTNRTAIQPYLKGEMTQVAAYGEGVKPFREFMLSNTRTQDLTMFTELSHADEAKSMDEVPTVTLVSAFVTSELRTAFQMGFVIYLPFVVVDVIVASVLMSLGMFMLPPAMISLPFKLLLFVLADGWTLVIQNLVASFR
jgi:flagellar biosynthetic protein FliP